MVDPFKPKPNKNGMIPMISPHGSEDVIFVNEKRWDYFKDLGWVLAHDYYRNLWREAEKSKEQYKHRLEQIRDQLDTDRLASVEPTKIEQSTTVTKSKSKTKKKKPDVIRTESDLAAVSGTFAAEMELREKKKNETG